MNPIKTWKANKWRIDLREFTRKFQRKFSCKFKKLSIIPGIVYAITYKGSTDIPTDKHHVTPLFLSFGKFKADGKVFIRGLNLLYLKNSQQLEVLDEAYKIISNSDFFISPVLLKKNPKLAHTAEIFSLRKLDSRIAPLIKLHEKWIKIAPFAFKSFEETKVLTGSFIDKEEWGMIPLLHTHVFGNFNSQALDESFQEENSIKESKSAGRKKTVNDKIESTKPETTETTQDEFVTIMNLNDE